MADQGSVAWWLDRLNRALDDEYDRAVLYRDYYEGRHREMFETSSYRRDLSAVISGVRVNFCVLVVDSARERLTIDGFRIGTDAQNEEAWRLWQANRLDARSDIAHTEALVGGVSYLTVEPNVRRPDTPAIRVVDPLTVVVAHHPEDPDLRVAALKRLVDDDGFELAWLYLPTAVYKFRATARRTNSQPRTESYWARRDIPGEAWPLPNPLGVVPVVPIINNPDSRGRGRSELAPIVPMQDVVNKLASDMVVASEFIAYPQRWVTGIEPPADDEPEAVDQFRAGVSRLWMSEGELVKFGQFEQGSLETYVSAIEMFVQHMASVSKTPPHYLLGQSGNFPSGESLKATETGLVSKVRQEQRFFGESWEEGLGLALRLGGTTVADPDLAEVVWRDPENRVQSELTDSLVKLQALGVPLEFLWERAGFTQVQIERMKVMRLQEALENPAAQVPFPGGDQAPAGQSAAGPADVPAAE